jgi:hypothetical protein
MTTFNQTGSEIVGIVGDTRIDPGETPHPMMYFPIFAAPDMIHSSTLVIRSGSDVTQFAVPVQRLLASMDPTLAVSEVLTMDQVLGRNTLEASFDATLLIVFAGLSLLLAAVDLFGVLAYVVAQRTTEMAFVSPSAPGTPTFFVYAPRRPPPALVGLLLGLVASAGSVKLSRPLLFGTRPFDLTVFATVTMTLIAVAVLSCSIPAWRASRLDPIQALRME